MDSWQASQNNEYRKDIILYFLIVSNKSLNQEHRQYLKEHIISPNPAVTNDMLHVVHRKGNYPFTVMEYR